ncbi:selenoprotein O1 isoform X1 [Periophthalmus magnuspinnatus]|nr:selenoprotein O1 isoform X1 [Periophthalmus magnuspinnatus]
MAHIGPRLGSPRCLLPGVSVFRRFCSVRMEDMGLALSQSCLERLPFDNIALKRLPLDSCEDPGVRQVKGACFSLVKPQPLVRPRFVAVSHQALVLLGLSGDEVLQEPRGAEYLSGSRVMPGSEPAAHCYCGHQFGQFAGQLGDGAACYLGEVKVPPGQNPDLLLENPSGRWEIQVKGAGLTPYSRQADGRKVLRSSIREFLCSEAMFFLGVPTTRAGSVVTSDSMVLRDIYYSGRPRHERCSVVLRIAPTFLRFGSFEIFKQADEFTGRQGPSYGRDEIRGQMMDYVIEMFYPEILKNFPDRVERNVAFFREVVHRTARLVAQWQCVGFCHGVLNTDNMSILGLTLDYGPYGFMDRFDPDFICNASDNSGRYSYQAQPAVCRWNIVKLAEALAPDLPPERAKGIIDEYMDVYNRFYLENMRRKLGLIKKEEPEDEMLITELLQTMHNTGADFTNTFRSLSQISCPTEGENEVDVVRQATQLLLEQCASLEELKAANKPTMDPRELAMLLSLAQTNPALFQMISDRATIARQLDKLSKLKDLMESSEEQLKVKQGEDWTVWITRYRKRLGRELEGQSDTVTAVQDERVKVMNSTNPRVVLRNYIAQNAIEAAENGDFSEVQRVLKVLEKPFTAQPGLELPTWVGKHGTTEEGEREEAEGEREEAEGEREEAEGEREEAEEEPTASTSTVRSALPYDSKPPAWAQQICVT